MSEDEHRLLILLEAYRAWRGDGARRELAAAMREIYWGDFRRFRRALAEMLKEDGFG